MRGRRNHIVETKVDLDRDSCLFQATNHPDALALKLLLRTNWRYPHAVEIKGQAILGAGDRANRFDDFLNRVSSL